MTTEHPPAGVPALAARDQEAIARTLTSLLAGSTTADDGSRRGAVISSGRTTGTGHR